MAGQPNKCCSLGVFKCFFHLFNLIFLFSGFGVLAIGAWSIFWRYHLVQIQSTHTYAIIVHTILFIGIVTTVANIIGYIGVWKENRCTIQYYIIFLLVICFLEMAIGVTASFYRRILNSELGNELNSTFVHNYSFHSSQTEAIDYIQTRYKCCGAVRFEDWRTSQWYLMNKNITKTTSIPYLCRINHNEAVVVPNSCCRTPSINCGCSDHPNNIYYDGCVYRVKREMFNHLTIIMWISFFIAGVQSMGILLSCILCVRVNDGIDGY